MELTIRRAQGSDREPLADLAARAWEPVFEAVNRALGPDLARQLHGDDWRVHHKAEVGQILASETTVTWVAEVDGRIVGLAAARIADPHRRIGEVQMLGVDPPHQRSGVGAALTRHAEGWLREQQVDVVFIGTGGDAGHAPARQLYEALGYRPFPVVQYYKILGAEA
jgi:GNAT superfamily N-acetyltransferase